MTELNKAAILEWVEALESGRYRQITGSLAMTSISTNDIGYCCLGVACDVFKDRLGLEVGEDRGEISFDGNIACLPEEVHNFLGLPDTEVHWEEMNRFVHVTQLNDVYELTFPEIAAIIRANFLEEETDD